jgi:anti-sigma regulatory factor (Ser/Thr protein kinase)
MNSSNPADREEAFPIDRYPDPVCEYTIEDEGPEVEAINQAFESVFGSVTPGVPVRTIVEQAGISIPDASHEFLDYLEGDDVFLEKVETVNNGYCARILPPIDETHGYILLIDRELINRDDSVSFSHASREPPEGDTDNAKPTKDSSGLDNEFDVNRVASVLSHDLRNPLDVAKARLQATRETGADEHFDHVVRAHERMERIIEDVLTLSRGAEYIEPDDTVDLQTVVESAWATVETGSATLTISDELPTAVADEDRTERLFENLFRNAVEHGNHPAITVGSLNDAGTGVYVTDDGPGIPSGEQSVIFEPGYSSHDHGTGLGLSIVKRIVESHGWTIEVKSENSGARFEIRGMGVRS